MLLTTRLHIFEDKSCVYFLCFCILRAKHSEFDSTKRMCTPVNVIVLLIMNTCVPSHFSLVWLFVNPCLTVYEPARLLCPWDSPGKNTGMGCYALLQGIFPTQEWNPCLLCLLHWKAGSLPPKPSGRLIMNGPIQNRAFTFKWNYLLHFMTWFHHIHVWLFTHNKTILAFKEEVNGK